MMLANQFPPEAARLLNDLKAHLRQNRVDIDRLWQHRHFGTGWPIGGLVPTEGLGGPWDEFPETSTSSSSSTTTTTTTTATGDDSLQLGEAVRRLKQGLQRITFRRDGSGEGVCWEIAPGDPPAK